jgi:hypothetical protein
LTRKIRGASRKACAVGFCPLLLEYQVEGGNCVTFGKFILAIISLTHQITCAIKYAWNRNQRP